MGNQFVLSEWQMSLLTHSFPMPPFFTPCFLEVEKGYIGNEWINNILLVIQGSVRSKIKSLHLSNFRSNFQGSLGLKPNETLCAIWYHLYNFKNVYRGVMHLVTLETEVCNFTKSNIPPWVFFKFFKLYKWQQIAQNMTNKLPDSRENTTKQQRYHKEGF